MKAILKKEINSFFASAEGYLIITVFLLLSGLFLWVFKTGYNIFDLGFADISAFFQWTPWIFMFLIPAVSMKCFSEEKKSGTLELLLTKPVLLKHIVLGKFLGILTLVVIVLLPTLLYVLTITKLRVIGHSIDYGSIAASYFGLLLLAGAYIAIGIFASAIASYQIIAFIIALSICFLMYYGFEMLGLLPVFNRIDFNVTGLGMKSRFSSISRGIIDTKDTIYFLSVTLFFLYTTQLRLKYSIR